MTCLVNCCLQYCCAQRLAFPFGEGAPVRTLGRKRFSQRHDDKHTGIYGKTPKRWFLPTAKRIFTLYQTSSVTQIGSEVPIWVPASPKGKPRALPRQCCKQQFTSVLTKADNLNNNLFDDLSNLPFSCVNSDLHSCTDLHKPHCRKYQNAGGTPWICRWCPPFRSAVHR